MKRIFVSVLIAILFSACRSNVNQPTKDKSDNSIVANASASETQALIKKFKPIIEGVWVKKEYIEDVARTKSPKESFEKANGITTMVIKTEFIKGDSILIDVGYGNHEGGNLIVKFRPGQLKGSIVLYSPGEKAENGHYELKYSLSKIDTSLTLFTIDSKNKLKNTFTYLKAFRSQNGKELGYGTDFLINKTLIAATYELSDSLNNNSKVSFTNDGQVFGLEDFKNYSVLIDYETPPNNLDQIIFDLNAKNQKTFVFKISKDTLKLYDARLSADSISLILGKLKYKLVRQK